MIHDGYGEHHPTFDDAEQMLIEEEEFLARNARAALVRKFGRGFAPGADEDAIQEARIAAWQSWVKHRNKAYMNIAVTQRLISYVHRDGASFGAPKVSNNNMGKDPHRTGLPSLDDPDVGLVVLAEDLLDQVLLAYHEGEIIEAINSLPQHHQEYVVYRFWYGLKPSEIAAIQGMTTSGVHTWWNRYIRPALAERLSHLQGVLT